MNHPCEDCRQSCDVPCWKVDHGLLVEPPRWISVEDGLPEERKRVLILIDTGRSKCKAGACISWTQRRTRDEGFSFRPDIRGRGL